MNRAEKEIALSNDAQKSLRLFDRFRRALTALLALLYLLLGIQILITAVGLTWGGWRRTGSLLEACAFDLVLALAVAALHSILRRRCFFTRALTACTASISAVLLVYALIWPAVQPERPVSFYFAFGGFALRMDLTGIVTALLAAAAALIFHYGRMVQDNEDLTL